MTVCKVHDTGRIDRLRVILASAGCSGTVEVMICCVHVQDSPDFNSCISCYLKWQKPLYYIFLFLFILRKRYVYCVHGPDGPGLNSPLVVDPNGTYFRRDGLAGLYLCGHSPPEDREPPVDRPDVDYTFFEEEVLPAIGKRVPTLKNLKVTTELNLGTSNTPVAPLSVEVGLQSMGELPEK